MASAPTTEIEYPSSDGQPMAETGIHVQAIILLHQALEDFFRDRPDVFIASDMFWYWQEGDPACRVAPDVMVVPGVGNHDRRSYFSWRENGTIPAIVFEMASQGTWKDDEEEKYELYEQLGVREYVLFDPEDLYLSSPLKAYRLAGSTYRRIRKVDGMFESQLGFRMKAEGKMLRLVDAKTGEPIPTRAEAVESARANAAAAEANAAAEKTRADALAAEVERLKALLKNQGSTNGHNP